MYGRCRQVPIVPNTPVKYILSASLSGTACIFNSKYNFISRPRTDYLIPLNRRTFKTLLFCLLAQAPVSVYKSENPVTHKEQFKLYNVTECARITYYIRTLHIIWIYFEYCRRYWGGNIHESIDILQKFGG